MSGGVLLVNGKPVTETSAATDPVTPVTESHIPSLLRCAHVGQDGLASADELAARIERAGRIVVVDAADEAELERLAQAIGLLAARCRSARAAAPLARVWAGAEQAGTVLVVVTSQRAARAQAAALIAGARCWMPAPAQLADADGWRAWSAALLDAPPTRAAWRCWRPKAMPTDSTPTWWRDGWAAWRPPGSGIAARPAWWPPAAMAPARCCARWTRAASRWPMK